MASKAESNAVKGEKSTQNSLLITEIKDGVVVMGDGSLRSVVLGSAINFDLMSPQEQEGVEFAFQGFLNSLHFSIQIVIKSQKMDIDGYLDQLRSKRAAQNNPLLGMLMEDYIANVKGLVEDVNIMDKQFYVTVPYFPAIQGGHKISLIEGIKGALAKTEDIVVPEEEFKKYKIELGHRTTQVAQGLTQIGIRAIALNTQELIDLFYTWYNPDAATQQKLIETEQLETPAVTKGEGNATTNLPGEPF